MITAAILLLRERHFGAWLILAGASVNLLTGIAGYVIPHFLMRIATPDQVGQVYQVIAAVGALGSLLVALGLLFHALHRRALHHRIAELERVLESLQG